MTTRRRTAVVVAALAAVGTLGACGGSPSPAASSSTTSSASTTTPASPSPSSSSSTSASPTSATPAAAQPVTRTVAELKKALLSLDDVPSGFAVEPPSKDNGGLAARSKDPKCAAFVRFSNAAKAPGSTASAEISFSGGQDGPSVDETLDALGTAARVAALQRTYKASIASCHSVTLAIPGVGTSPVTVQVVSPPAYGKNPLAARMTFSSGPLKGTELNLVTTGVGDTVLTMTFVGSPPDDVDAATSVAVEKATQTLGVGTGT